MAKVKIEQYKSTIGSNKAQKATIEALGFKKHKKVIEKELNSAVEGMIKKIPHLVRIVEEK